MSQGVPVLILTVKDKAVPLQACSGPEGSRVPRFRDNGTEWW